MLTIAGGIVLGWLAILVIRAVAGRSSRPTPSELTAAADAVDRIGRRD